MKFFKFIKDNVDWKDAKISMGIFLSFFTLIATVMVVGGMWELFSKVTLLFYSVGFFVSVIIIIFGQLRDKL